MPEYREIENPLGGYIDPSKVIWMRHDDNTVLPIVNVHCDECRRNLTLDYYSGEAWPTRVSGDSRYGYALYHECTEMYTRALNRLQGGNWVSPINNKIGEVIVLLRELKVSDKTIYNLVENIE